MCKFLIVIFFLFSKSIFGQSIDSCAHINAKKTNITVYIKGHLFADTAFLPANELKKGIELVSLASSVKIISFKMAVDCDGCDIIEACTVGAKVQNPWIYRTIPDNMTGKSRKWLLFHNITIQIGKQLLTCPEFIVFLK